MRESSRVASAVAVFCVACVACAACGGGSPGNTGFEGNPDGGASSSSSSSSSSSGSNVGSFGDGGGGTSCMHDSDCPAGSHCVIPPGTEGAGVGTCTPVDGGAPEAASPPQDAGGSPPGIDAGLPPVDLACMNAPMCNSGLASVFPPAVPLLPPDVPANCSNGFEMGDANTCGGTPVSYVIHATPSGGSRAITLDVDFATYLEPDGVLITGVDSTGSTYTLLDTSRLQTWTSADPTGGTSRPPDATIRQFRIDVRQGTTQLTVDFGGVVSPMYLQVLGLCDFDLTSFSSQSRWWQAVP